MARTARKISDSGVYHVLLRGVNEFLENNADKEYFRKLLEKYFSKDRCVLLGYRFFEKKVHLVIKESGAVISDTIKPFCTAYARYFNRSRNSDGKIFAGRYKSEPIENTENLKSCLKYIYSGIYDKYINDDLIENKFTAEEIEKAETCLCMDDYEAMSDADIINVIEYFCGNDEKFSTLENGEKADYFHEKDINSRVRIGLVLKALGVKKAKKVLKNTEKDIVKESKINAKNNQVKQKKKELSVWLL